MHIREAMNIVNEAISPPVTYEQVVTLEWIEEVLDYGFDVGKPHPKANTDVEGGYDWHSMYRMLRELKVRGIIPDHVDIDDNQQNARPYIEKWFKERYRYVLNWIAAEQMDDGYVVYRAITLPSIEYAKVLASDDSPLGEFWSFARGEAFWGNSDHGTCRMKAVVATNAIDWITTIRRNMNYVVGEDEMEVSLPKGTPVRLLSVRYKREEIPVGNPDRRT